MRRLPMLVAAMLALTACDGTITGVVKIPCPDMCPPLDSALIWAKSRPFPNALCCPLVAPDTTRTR